MNTTTTAAPTPPAVAPRSVRTTVPAYGHGAADGWRRLLTTVPPDATAARDLEGPWLAAGATVEVPCDALVLAVDHHSPERWEITALRAGAEGLTETARWTRRSPLGRRECTRLRTLLARDAPGHAARVLTMPNRHAGHCRWCTRELAAGSGLVHHTSAGTVLVCPACPARPARLPVNLHPGRCPVCEGWVTAGEGAAVFVGGTTAGRYRPVHRTCPEHPLPGPPVTADTWCLDCRTALRAGTGYWDRGPHHAPGACTAPADGLPRWTVRVPTHETGLWQTRTVRRIHHTPRPGEPQLPANLPGGRMLADTGHMTVLAHIVATRTTRGGRTTALARAATWSEAAPALAAELDTALAARPDDGTFLAREVIERIHGDRGWVAEITGHDPRHGLSRTFLTPQTDYDQADSHGQRGVLDAWTLRPRRVYEVSRPLGPPAANWRAARRQFGPRTRVTQEQRAFVRVTADGDITEITREEAQAWLNAALEWMS